MQGFPLTTVLQALADRRDSLQIVQESWRPRGKRRLFSMVASRSKLAVTFNLRPL